MPYVPAKLTLGLIRAHYDGNDAMFKEYLLKIVNYFENDCEYERADELAEFCLAQAGLIPTFGVNAEFTHEHKCEEIIRCRDCKNSRMTRLGILQCQLFVPANLEGVEDEHRLAGMFVPDEGFCAWAEKVD